MRPRCSFGGVSKEDQLDRIVSPTHIIAATPGRLVDFLEKKELTLRRVTYVVLDEAEYVAYLYGRHHPAIRRADKHSN